uniref:ATP synthase complex subunit 8 n=1 Tax=Yunnanites coriacea TaxID=369694 RepID=A0A7L9QDP7_9ORTH|nr:ATP synthase F0 subunit 8 [Yunnanites coriacea]
MPQMSPLMWFSLFIMFSITLILFNQYYFFSFKNNKTMLTKKKLMWKNKMYWKW